MRLDKFIVVFVVLIGTCFSKILINPIKSDGFDELQDAAIKILTTCYADKDKTIGLIGNFPGTFNEKLSSYTSFSPVLLDNTRRPMDNIVYDINMDRRNQDVVHKIHIIVIVSATMVDMMMCCRTVMQSRYYNAMASVLVIAWSPERKYAGCDKDYDTVNFFYNANLSNWLNVNVLCRHPTNETMLFTSNPFTTQAPEPWKLKTIFNLREYPMFSLFKRKYHERKGMCKSLDFDRTRDVGSYPIGVLYMFAKVLESDENELKTVRQLHRNKRRFTHFKDFTSYANEIADHIGIESFRTHPSTLRELVESADYIWGPREWLQANSRITFINNFLTYVNATQKKINMSYRVGRNIIYPSNVIMVVPTFLHALQWLYFTDVTGFECDFLVTQFRGNKSQLRKILDVIDSYSWYGMYVTFIVTLIFFKYFMRQPLLIGILNLCRLICNTGLTTLPPDIASQVYLALLLCFVVTMQGIFSGNLAALLTHDVPIRQVNSIQDLVDFNYTIYVPIGFGALLNDSRLQGRLIETRLNEECLSYVLRVPRVACLTWGASTRADAERSNLYVSDRSEMCGFLANSMVWNWPFRQSINIFLRIAIGGGFLLSLDEIVVEKIFLERDAEEVPVEPRIMVFHNLAFAFTIFGIGLVLAIIAFIGEIIFYRIHRGVTNTRVVKLNRGKRTKRPSLVRHITKRIKKIR